MRDDLTRAGRRRFLRLVGAGAGVGVGLPAATGAASARTVAWERTYRHENRPSQITDIARTRDGGYVAVGSTYLTGVDEANAWAVKLDADGDEEWNRAYDADGDYDFWFESAVTEVSDGYVAVTRFYESGSFHVLRIDRDGDVAVSRRVDRTDSSVDGGVDVVAVSEGDGPEGVAVLASSREGDDGDVWLLRLDAELDVLWEWTYGDETSLLPAGLVGTADGGFAFAATVSSATEGDDLWLGRVDDRGRPCWSRTYDGSAGDTQAVGVAERRRDGRTTGYAVAGTTRSATGWRLRAVSAAPDGTLRAERTFEAGDFAEGSDVVATDDGYAFLASASPLPDDVSLFLAVTDDGLGVRWSEFYGRSESYYHIEEAAALTYADGEYGLAGAYLSGGDLDTAQGYVVSVTADE